jgi:hypothetical protein
MARIDRNKLHFGPARLGGIPERVCVEHFSNCVPAGWLAGG